jgi:hypothetical protein
VHLCKTGQNTADTELTYYNFTQVCHGSDVLPFTTTTTISKKTAESS